MSVKMFVEETLQLVSLFGHAVNKSRGIAH